ncbi:MAG TPA: cytochrome c [Myxococcaceae bacterium]|nr:cytochrome c [Myxococcaceae bacterium]
MPLLGVLSACTPAEVPVKDLGKPVARIEIPVLPGDGVPRAELKLSTPATALSTIAGAVAVGTPVGLLQLSASKLELTLVNVTAGPGEPTTTGKVKLLARREDGLFVWSDAGLFHEDKGRLLLSPLSASLAGADLRALDVFGASLSEELWIVDGEALEHVGGGTLTRIAIAGVEAVDLAVGIEPGQALAAAGGSVYLIDLNGPEAWRVMSGLGAVSGFARDESGAVYLATGSGLLARDKAGEFSLQVLAGEGSSSVEAVAARSGAVLLTSNGRGLTLAASVATILGETTSKMVAIDGKGDGWVAEDGALIQLKTGAPVSFAAEVRPFFEGHCNGCHATGANAAPIIHWDDYDTARQFALAASRRLQADGVPPMPPANVEVLSPRDFTAVVRWIQGGMQP